MAEYTGLTPEEIYLDDCIQTMIAVGNTYTRLQASEFKQLIIHYQACFLSFASLFNSRTRLVMHLIGTYQTVNLIDRIYDQVMELKMPSELVTDTINIANQMSAFVSKINEYKTVIESANPELTGLLNIYSDSANTDGINLLIEAQSQPIFMNYLSLRDLISYISKLNQFNSDYQDINESWRETKTETIINKPVVLLGEISTYLSNLMEFVEITDAIAYSCSLLEGLYTYTGFSSKDEMNSFFNSKYDTIKAAVIKSLA